MKTRQTVGPNMRRMVCAFFLAAVLVLSGCATPVGVRPLDSQEANRRLTETVLSDAKLSAPTVQILNRAGLEKQFQSEPAETIAALHQALPTARVADRLFALAELSFLHAAKSGDRSYFLAAAVYAYAFLFPQGSGASPDPFDPRFRTAVDLYNRGITGGFAEPENRQVLIPERRRVILEEGVYRLPFGELSVRIDPDEFRYGPFRMVNFVDTAELEVRGLRNTYRWPGIGASLVAALKHRPGEQVREFAMVPATLRVAATAFLRLENVEEGIRTGRMEGRLTLHTTQEETSVTVGDRAVPLEYALTAALADTLEGSQAYAIELKGLFSGDFKIFKDTARFKDNVFLMAPYRPGRIPLVLVHGTASSPARWAQMLNEILNDQELWNRYQVWLFTYNTGNPILYSGGILTQGLRSVVQQLDPTGQDERPAEDGGHRPQPGRAAHEADRHRQRRAFLGAPFQRSHRSARRLARIARTAPAQPLLQTPAFCPPSRLHLHAAPRQPFIWRLYHRFAETSDFVAPYASQPAAGDFPKEPRGRHDKCDGG